MATGGLIGTQFWAQAGPFHGLHSGPDQALPCNGSQSAEGRPLSHFLSVLVQNAYSETWPPVEEAVVPASSGEGGTDPEPRGTARVRDQPLSPCNL